VATDPSSSYGVALQATAKNTGSTLIIERATNAGMSVNLATIYSVAGVTNKAVYSKTDYLTNDGVVRYYRATESKTGSTNGVSAVQSSAPYDLGGGAP